MDSNIVPQKTGNFVHRPVAPICSNLLDQIAPVQPKTMFFAPPALRRRRHTQLIEHSPSITSSISTPSTPSTPPIMGNLNSQEGGALVATASNLIAQSGAGFNLSDVVAAATATGAAPSAGAITVVQVPRPAPSNSKLHKFQCRFCIECFPRKFNRDRHETRKHHSEVEEEKSEELGVQSTAASTMVQGRKRKADEIVDADEEITASSRCAIISGESNSTFTSHKQLEVQMVTGDSLMSDTRSSKKSRLTLTPNQDRDETERCAISIEPDVIDIVVDEVVPKRDHEAESDSEVQVEAEVAAEETLFPPEVQEQMIAADQQIGLSCRPFLSWLCSPALTEPERMVKGRRADPDKLKPIKKNLVFLFKALLSSNTLLPLNIKLEAFTQLEVCQAVGSFLESRTLGASRIYGLFLLIKKVLVYLSSRESTRRSMFVLPSTWNSWTYVDSLCCESNNRRKQLSRNRRLLGASECKRLEQSQPMQLSGDRSNELTAAALTMPPLFGPTPVKKKPNTVTVTVPVQSRRTSPEVQSVQETERSSNEMTTEELQKVTHGSLDYLRSRLQSQFVAHLVDQWRLHSSPNLSDVLFAFIICSRMM